MTLADQLAALADQARTLEADSRALRALTGDLGLPADAPAELVLATAREKLAPPKRPPRPPAPPLPTGERWSVEENAGVLVLWRSAVERRGCTLRTVQAGLPTTCRLCGGAIAPKEPYWRSGGAPTGAQALDSREVRVCQACVAEMRGGQ